MAHDDAVQSAGARAHAHDHAHDSDHDHTHDHDAHDHGALGHDHSHASSETRIGVAALLTGAFMGVELAGGLIAGSLALMADAGHMLSDFASLALAWFGFRIARRPADALRTFGFRRFSVLAAFTNGLALVAVAGWIILEAVMRLMSPEGVLAGPMLWIASAGLVVNILSFAVLHGADRSNLNVRGALLHVAGDLFGSLAAIAAALIIMTTGWTRADPLLSILVAAIILRSAWVLIADAGHILLEGAPRHLDLADIGRDLAGNIEGVLNIHHAHAWSIDEKKLMMTLHACISDDASGPEIVGRIKQRLADVHGVAHATVEIGHDDCAGPDCG
ncbi:MAG: cation diffusion facilitator family transporter [Alphaproteobacteria bacterium]|nr:cation diffusion facilitator family transporter [Alphaproteobacteria bacterium]